MKIAVMLMLLISCQSAYAADLALVHEKLAEVCPIVGVSGSVEDIANLRIDFAPDATATQKKAARDALKALAENPAAVQPPDVESFLEECLDSEAFTTEELVQILYCERQKNTARRNALILKLVAKAPPERQAKLLELAGKHHIALPIK